MKKAKNLLLLTLMVLGLFLVVGKVKADNPWNFTSAWLVCDPEALEPGTTSTCYYFGKIGGTTTNPNAGFYTQMYSTDNLIIESVEVNKNISTNASAAIVKTSATSSTAIKFKDDMPEGLSKFKCIIGSDVTADTKSRACGVFYTKKTASSNAFAATSMSVYGTLTNNDLEKSSYQVDTTAVLGAVIVKLDDGNDVDKCGNLCIVSYAVAESTDWNHADCHVTDGTMHSDWDTSVTCDTGNPSLITPAHHLPSGVYDCFEIEMKSKTVENDDTPESGAFVSYAILAAGALIAISAVTIAKKHNRLQKI